MWILLKVFGFIAWLILVAGLVLWFSGNDWLTSLKINERAELFRGIGILLIAAGIAPIGLALAQIRTKSLQTQIVSREFVYSAQMLGGDGGVVVRSSGIEALRSLAITNDDRAAIVIRILASHVRSSSSDIIHKIVAKNSNEKRRDSEETQKEEEKILCLPVEECRKALDVYAKKRTMPADIESSYAALREIIGEKNKILRSMRIEQKPKKGIHTLDLSNSIFINSALSRTNLTRANLSQIHANSFAFEGTCFDFANLTGAYFNRCTMEECDFNETEFQETTMVDIVLDNVHFRKATFVGRCEFIKCSFKSAVFKSAKFSRQCIFDSECIFTEADFNGAIIYIDSFAMLQADSLRDADFSKATIYAQDERLAREKLSCAKTGKTSFSHAPTATIESNAE